MASHIAPFWERSLRRSDGFVNVLLTGNLDFVRDELIGAGAVDCKGLATAGRAVLVIALAPRTSNAGSTPLTFPLMKSWNWSDILGDSKALDYIVSQREVELLYNNYM